VGKVRARFTLFAFVLVSVLRWFLAGVVLPVKALGGGMRRPGSESEWLLFLVDCAAQPLGLSMVAIRTQCPQKNPSLRGWVG
jgi:hypothetical protein